MTDHHPSPARSASTARRPLVIVTTLAAVAALGLVCLALVHGPSLLDLVRSPSAGPAAHREESGRAGPADGELPDDATIHDDDLPGIARLDDDLTEAVTRATADARDDGITVYITTGWRSESYQQRLMDDAIAEHGSKEEAARFVAPPAGSAHVSGQAVDVGSYDAMQWFMDHGADYGLCQIYANENWHFELRPHAADEGCPDMYEDVSEDPRMQE